MRRRSFIHGGLAAGAALTVDTVAPTGLQASASAPAAAMRLFEVTTTIDLPAPGEAAQLWLPLFQSAAGYQRLLGLAWDGNGTVALQRDPTYGARLLHARWAQADSQHLTVVQRVATWERSALDAAAPASRAEREFWTRPTPGLPTDGIVRDTALRIVGDRREPRARLRAIYDWVVANTWRDAAVAGCGDGNIARMLRENRLGGKCADINRLMVGLCRAGGIPARDVYGIRLAESRLFKSLGRADVVSGAQHCRAEAYLDAEGWFAVDPADVRKAVLEDKLAVDSPAIVGLGDRLFGAWESNWAGYNSATGITLAGAPHPPAFDFLMYPAAMTATKVLNCLDAASFRYTITSREVTV